MHRYSGCLPEPSISAAVKHGTIKSHMQCQTPFDRACRGQAKITAKLIVEHDPDEWDLPPKPKWMRWRTYNRYMKKFDAYEETVGPRLSELVRCFLDES